MIIREIEMENIRSHTHTKINFPTGTILFEGDIGSGKTTILMALEFAMFGNSTPNFYRNLMRKGAKKAYVRVKFEVNGQEYEIYRSLVHRGRGISNDESYAITPEGKVPLTGEEIRSYVLNLMGVRVQGRRRRSLPIVTYAIYTPQETMKSILEGRDEERIEVIRKMFKLDEYRIAKDNSDIVVEHLKLESARIKDYRDEMENIQSEMERIELQIKEMENNRNETRAELERLVAEHESVKRKLENYEKLRAERDRLSKELSVEKSIKRQLEEQLVKKVKKLDDMKDLEARLKELEGPASKYVKLKKEREKLESEIESMNQLERERVRLNASLSELEGLAKELDEINNKIKNLNTEIQEVEVRIKGYGDLESQENELDKMLQTLNVAFRRNQEKREEIEKRIDELKGIGAICPTCQRPLSEEHKHRLIDEAKKELSKIEENLENISRKKKKISTELEEVKGKKIERKNMEIREAKLRSSIDELKSRKSELESRAKKIAEIRRELSTLEQRISEKKDIREKYERLKVELQDLEKAWREHAKIQGLLSSAEDLKKEIEGLEGSIKASESKIKKLESEIEALHYDENAHKNTHDNYVKLRESISELRERIRAMEEEIKNRREEMSLKKKRYEELERRIEESRKKEELKNWILEKFKPALEDIERMRLSTINEDFRILFEEWFIELMGESEYSATVDENFKPIIRYQHYDMPMDTLSGGERTSVALAYRLALNSMVKRALRLQTNLLILDEPTDGFSKDQLYKLKDILDRMDTDQIIIVSHEKELRNLADVIFRVEKSNGKSEVKEVQ